MSFESNAILYRENENNSESIQDTSNVRSEVSYENEDEE